jgi:hypothetical protein
MRSAEGQGMELAPHHGAIQVGVSTGSALGAVEVV